MSDDETAHFAETIGVEANLVERFVVILREEQTALVKGDIEGLSSLLQQKNDLAVQLGVIGAQRHDFLLARGLTADHAGMEMWCSRHPKENITSIAWSRVLSGAQEAQRLNRLNGELIRLRMTYNAQALEALRRGDTCLGLYGPDGQTTLRSGNRLNDAV